MRTPRRAEFQLVLGGVIAGLLLTECICRVFRLSEYSGGEGPARQRRVYQYNRMGFRGPETPAEDLAGKTVILGLGDSFAFGQGVDWEDVSLTRLEAALNESGEKRYRVLNHALPGMSTAQEYHYLMERGFRLDPKVLILLFTLNDAEWTPYSYRALTPWPETEKRVLWRSHLFFYLVYAYNSVAHRYVDYVRGLYEEGAPRFADFRSAFGGIAAQCRQRGVVPVLAIFPLFDEAEDYPYAEIHERLKAMGERAGYRVVDLLSAYQASGRPLHRYRVSFHDGHPNAAAHALAAETLRPVVEQALRASPPASPVR